MDDQAGVDLSSVQGLKDGLVGRDGDDSRDDVGCNEAQHQPSCRGLSRDSDAFSSEVSEPHRLLGDDDGAVAFADASSVWQQLPFVGDVGVVADAHGAHIGWVRAGDAVERVGVSGVDVPVKGAGVDEAEHQGPEHEEVVGIRRAEDPQRCAHLLPSAKRLVVSRRRLEMVPSSFQSTRLPSSGSRFVKSSRA